MNPSPATLATEHVRIALAERGYDIAIGAGLIDNASAWQGLPKAAAALIVTNDTVAPLYLATLQKSLEPHYPRLLVCTLPDGESHKTWESLNQIFDVLLANACDRHTVLLALGGGVIGDMTGFAAACYMRGVPFVQVPTTLLAQVDACIGGKTGIDTRQGKNLVGSFHQPRLVLEDIAVLDTLGVQRAHVMGLSMGGMIVQTMAIQHRDRLLTMTSVMSTTGEPEYRQSSPRAWDLLTAPGATNREEYVQQWINGLREWGSPEFADEARWRADAERAFDEDAS